LKNASFIAWPRADLVPQDIQQLYPLVRNTTIMLGIVWPDAHVAFPDFLDPTNATMQWWTDELKLFHQQVHRRGACFNGDNDGRWHSTVFGWI
jgi:alpha-glucosidase